MFKSSSDHARCIQINTRSLLRTPRQLSLQMIKVNDVQTKLLNYFTFYHGTICIEMDGDGASACHEETGSIISPCGSFNN